MSLDDYKVVLYRNQPDGWVAEVPAISGCYALMPTREEALAELAEVFRMISEEVPGTQGAVTCRYHRDRPCLAPGPMNFVVWRQN